MSQSLPDQSERPVRYGMLYPHKIEAEYDAITGAYWVHFGGADGSRISVGLSREQAEAMMGMRSRDPLEFAKSLYIKGHIELDEFEARMHRAVGP